MGLSFTGYATSTGELRDLYDRMREVPGIIEAHSIDPGLIAKVVGASTTLNGAGPLSLIERELVNALTSRLNQCLYWTACHAEALRVALDGQHPELPGQVLDSPRAPITATRRMGMLAELTTKVTEAPWSLSRDDRDRAHLAGLSDEDILHAIALSAYFGHLNRIADAVGIPLDHKVQRMPPATDPGVPALAPSTIAVTGRPALELARRPATAAALTAWRCYMFDRNAPVTRRSRTVIARWVALWLGDGGISTPSDLTVNPIDDALRELAELVTLAPWQLGDQSFTRLRAVGYNDAQLFDAVAVASSAGVFSRITVALGSLGRLVA